MKHIFTRFFITHWKQVLVGQIAFAATTFISNLIPVVAKSLVNAEFATARWWFALAIALSIGIWYTNYHGNMQTDILRNNMLFFGRVEMLKKLERCRHLPDHKELLNYVQNDSTTILNEQVELIINWIGFGIDLIIGCGIVWYFLGFTYMMILFVVCAVIVGILKVMTNNANKYNKIYHEISVRFRMMLIGFGTLFQDYLLNNNTRFARERIHEYEKTVHNAFKIKRQLKNNINAVNFAMRSITPIVIIFMIKLIIPAEKFDPINVLTLISYFYYIYNPLQMILQMANHRSELDVVLKKVEEVMGREELSETDGKISLKGPVESIEFDNVKYTVTKDNQVNTILNGISLNVKRGEKVGLVGPSGTGKSTLVKALYRDIDITSGSVKINGRDVTEYTRASLYDAFFIVSQESRALEGTIKENLQVANSHASDSEMKAALAQAGLDGFNLDEVVEGDGARQLSGGERQRLAIARMFLRPEVKVIVLDEATSALDEQTQFDVLSAIHRFQKEGNRIIFSIAHRLSTVRNADMICVLSNGKIVEQGNHDALTELRSEYFKLAKAGENLWKD